MNSLSDWLEILGYLFVLGALLYGLFLLLPKAPAESEAPSPEHAPAAAGETPRTPLDWARAADVAEHYAPGHAERVASLALALAEAVSLPQAARPSLELAALLHDVGEIDFEPDLLATSGPLGQAELYRVWEHAVRGAHQAWTITKDPAVSQWVRWHHERWDGLGYPDGLAGTEIPLPARILRLADSADAMLHNRPYRQALTPEETIGEINRLAAVAYDPALARVFVDQVLPAHLAAQESQWR